MAGLSTPAAEGYNSKLMTGFAEMFQAEGLGEFSTSGVYDANSWGLFIGLTPDHPDRAITLMTYPVEDTNTPDVITGLQIRFRGGRDPREVENQSDAVFNLIHLKQHYSVNGVRVLLSWRQSGAWMGQDGNQRIERVENYYVRADRVTPNKLP